MLPGDATPFEAVKQTQMIGLSPGMTQLKKEIEIVAASDLNVLISGETGTGKELVAKAIHEASPRAVNPLVSSTVLHCRKVWRKVSCSAKDVYWRYQ